jgi:hypothetical protein
MQNLGAHIVFAQPSKIYNKFTVIFQKYNKRYFQNFTIKLHEIYNTNFSNNHSQKLLCENRKSPLNTKTLTRRGGGMNLNLMQ